MTAFSVFISSSLRAPSFDDRVSLLVWFSLYCMSLL